jgi:hypothetical protein
VAARTVLSYILTYTYKVQWVPLVCRICNSVTVPVLQMLTHQHPPMFPSHRLVVPLLHLVLHRMAPLLPLTHRHRQLLTSPLLITPQPHHVIHQPHLHFHQLHRGTHPPRPHSHPPLRVTAHNLLLSVQHHQDIRQRVPRSAHRHPVVSVNRYFSSLQVSQLSRFTK